jgi:precorrin-6B methylase 2
MEQNSIYKISIRERFLQLSERTLDKFLKISAFQRYVNRKANNKYGMNFVTYLGNGTIDDVFSDYNFSDIQKDDIVLDIGANVGAFSIFISKFVKHVYSVEPMLYEILGMNVINNDRENITIFDDALGEGTLIIQWEGCSDRYVDCKSLSELIEMCGGHVDFLKCDCEGGEWVITANDLKNVRRLEAEVHNFDGKHNLQDFLKMLDEANFEYNYIEPRQGILKIHARNKLL